jgi:hypothetical protein
MPVAFYSSRQTLLVRLHDGPSADAVVAVLDDLAQERILRIAELEVLPKNDDRETDVAVLVVEHLWPARLEAALAGANAELVTDPEPPSVRAVPAADRLAQVQELNELRRIGTLTEAEFATAKRELLTGQSW